MNIQTLLIPGIAWIIGIIIMVSISKGHKERSTWIILSIILGFLAVIFFGLRKGEITVQAE